MNRMFLLSSTTLTLAVMAQGQDETNLDFTKEIQDMFSHKMPVEDIVWHVPTLTDMISNMALINEKENSLLVAPETALKLEA